MNRSGRKAWPGVRFAGFLTAAGLCAVAGHAQAQSPPQPQALPAPLAGSGTEPPVRAEARVSLSLSSAVRSALRQHPALVQARAQLDQARALERLGRGPFDVILSSSLEYTRKVARSFDRDGRFDLTSNETAWVVGASKSLHSGTRFDATLQLGNSSLTPPDQPALKTGGLNFAVTQPLLRNGGSTGAASGLLSAEHQRRAAEFSVEHVAQTQVLAVINAYWQLAAADQSLILAQTSLARAQKILDETRLLVQADQRPRGDMRALEGNLASRRRDVIASEGQRVRALTTLRLAMGLDIQTRPQWDASDALPSPLLPSASIEALTQQALGARRDLRAFQESVQSSEAAYRGSEHNALPQLDVSVNVGYEGALDERGAGAVFASLGHPAGLNAGASVTLELPVENNAQGGARDAAAAGLRSARTELWDQTRTVRSEVAAAYEDLRLSIDQVTAAREGELQYDLALADERYKLRAGLSTVIDVVLTEDLLTSAIRGRIGAQLQLAAALAQLRFAIGSLPGSEDAVAAALGPVMGGAGDER